MAASKTTAHTTKPVVMESLGASQRHIPLWQHEMVRKRLKNYRLQQQEITLVNVLYGRNVGSTLNKRCVNQRKLSYIILTMKLSNWFMAMAFHISQHTNILELNQKKINLVSDSKPIYYCPA